MWRVGQKKDNKIRVGWVKWMKCEKGTLGAGLIDKYKKEVNGMGEADKKRTK